MVRWGEALKPGWREWGYGRRCAPAWRMRRVLVWVLGWVLAASALWWWACGVAISRSADVRVASAGSGHGALRWLPADRPESPQGMWLSFAPKPGATIDIEIAPSGVANEGAPGFELWLYEIRVEGGGTIDPKAVLATPGRSSSGWVPFEQGPGIVYVGNGPGWIRVPVPAGPRVKAAVARTDRGGKVTLRLGDAERVVDLNARVQDSIEVGIEPLSVDRLPFEERVGLPSYAIDRLWIEGEGLSVERAELVIGVFGREWSRRVLDVQLAAGRIELGGPLGTGAGARGVVALACFGGTLAALVLWRVLRSAARFAIMRPRAACWVLAWGVVGAASAWMATLGVTFVTPDGLDYLSAGWILAERGSLDGFSPFKAPGMGFLVALAMLFDEGGIDALRVMHAGMGVLSAGLVAISLRNAIGGAAGRWAGLFGFALVGASPVLTTYQAYVLRESSATLIVSAVAFLLVEFGRRARGSRSLAPVAVSLGLVCGVGAYVRENLQLFVVFVPLALALVAGSRWRAGLVAGVAAGVLALAVASPWLLRMERKYGTFGMVLPKLQGNRALNAWTHGLTDGNDAAIVEYADVAALRERLARGPVSDFEFVEHVLVVIARNEAELASEQADGTVGGERPSQAAGAGRSGLHADKGRASARGLEELVDESLARNPVRAFAHRVSALGSLLGVWTDGSPHSNSGHWYSAPLRGKGAGWATNYQMDVPATLAQPRQPPLVGMDKVVPATQRSVRSLIGHPVAGLFDTWYAWWGPVRFGVGAAFLVGLVLAIRARAAAVGAVGGIALLSVVAAAWVAMTPVDRFAAPFWPAFIIVALWAVAHTTRIARERHRAAA